MTPTDTAMTRVGLNGLGKMGAGWGPTQCKR